MKIEYSFDKRFTELLESIEGLKNGKEMLELEGISPDKLDINSFAQDFFKTKTTVADVSVDANSNVDALTVSAYVVESNKANLRLNGLYLLWQELESTVGEDKARELIKKQVLGNYYINDLHGINQPYCFNFSTYDVALLGMPFVSKIKSEPPRHLSSFIGQMIHFSVYASNSVLGAVGLADLLIVSSYYVDKLLKENPTVPRSFLWGQVKQELQSFIFSCNQPFRGGIQSGFYNISIFDDKFLDKLCAEYKFPDGGCANKKTVKKLQDLFLDLMSETLEKTAFTFPVLTACFSVNKHKTIRDKKFLNFITEKNKQFGNINLFFGETSVLSSCCRLRSSTDNPYFNQFGAGGTKIGSLGVVTLNLPRIAYHLNNKECFLLELGKLAEDVCLINQMKRQILEHRIKNGFLPLYDEGFMSLHQQYSTIGINGLNEAVELLGMSILSNEGKEFVKQALSVLNDVAETKAKEYNAPHNVEQTPSENSAIKLAKKDELLGLNTEYELYSNQFIPLTTNANMLDRINIQGEFDSMMSGGAICHINLEEKIEDIEKLKKLYKFAAKKGVVYMALNYKIKQCERGHLSVSSSTKCDICQSVITNEYSRVVGFLVNTKNMHKTRREGEFPNRIFYKGDL